MAGKRGFGSVRKLPSGRWQARYRGPDGQMRPAPRTFATKKSAEQWLSTTEVQILQGDWIDPERSKVTVASYVQRWIDQRPGLRPKTVGLYEWLLQKHIEPTELGGTELGRLTTPIVRQWRAERLDSGVSEIATAKAYRLVRAALNTAVDEDKIIPRNPCRVRGADKEYSPERPVLTIAQVFTLAAAVPDRYRVLVLLTAFCSLRWGEVTALTREDFSDGAVSVRIGKALVELPGKGLVVSPPKSRAGLRTLTVPEAIRADVLAHLDEYVADAPTSYVFTGLRGNPLRRSNFSQIVKWGKLTASVGLAGVHFHDLRHAGNLWASKSGMSTKDLMARMGHDDMRAALIYQRATDDAERRIAEDLSRMATAYREGRSGG
ncbi:tyrosine-type recombinase/integrase [Nocardia cyriacigeorgica]|uniref:tyrosine-type recombinase/integrase n=1 Tax=Nocardia cyriacigeorgica TaxID=135487 RepID=UPI000CEB58D5|nr:tyrosine-type recombinase/integrase [Nocardia cyriacigeorgica]AVH21711.1 site-specific integrase [Nocardia cyriacigeorgica]MBF6425399.1 tyrosine-type recombinase/integrase [Nocardia cyriacigeorgica]